MSIRTLLYNISNLVDLEANDNAHVYKRSRQAVLETGCLPTIFMANLNAYYGQLDVAA